MICDKHKLNPVRGYSQCVGCELECLNGKLKDANEEITLLQKALNDLGVTPAEAKDGASRSIQRDNRIAELDAILKESCSDARATGPYECGVGPCPEIAELEADCKVMAEGLLRSHEGDYEINDYNHPEFETNNNRLPCICPACTIAAKYREEKLC